jgi:hypothetical protein
MLVVNIDWLARVHAVSPFKISKKGRAREPGAPVAPDLKRHGVVKRVLGRTV